MPTQEEVIKEIASNICMIHETPPFIGNVSTIIPVLTCCQDFKDCCNVNFLKNSDKRMLRKPYG